MGRRAWPEHIPRKRVSTYVVNGVLVDVFDAICLVEHLKPAQLVHEIVRQYCERRATEPAIVQLVAARKAWQEAHPPKEGLRLIPGGKGA